MKITKSKKDKKVEPKAVKVTDILEEYFFVDDVEKVKRIYMNGDKIVKEEIATN